MTDDDALIAPDPSDVRLCAAECEMLGQNYAAAMLERCADRIAEQATVLVAAIESANAWHEQCRKAEAERDALLAELIRLRDVHKKYEGQIGEPDPELLAKYAALKEKK